MADLTQILEELRAMRRELEGLRLPSCPEEVKCQGVTGKGGPCRNRAVGGTGYCRMHGEREAKPPKAPKAPKKPKKPKKIQPEHTHGVGETPTEACPLCDTHGDVWDPELPGCRFIGDEVTFESC